MLTKEEIEKRFTYHPPKEGQPEKYEQLRAKYKELAEFVVDVVPNSREQSEALTCLETSNMFANAGIARRS